MKNDEKERGKNNDKWWKIENQQWKMMKRS